MVPIGGGRSIREVGVVAVYAAAVALPFAAFIPLISTVGVPIAVSVTAAIVWIALARGRERVSVPRGAAIGALVGAAFHMVYSVGYAACAYLANAANEDFLDVMSGGLKMGVVTTIFGSVISVPVGVLAFVCYVRLLRRQGDSSSLHSP